MQEKSFGTSYAVILGQMIKVLRENQIPPKDQKYIADKLGVSVMTISRIEKGESVLDVPQMEEIANIFNINPVDFLKKSLDIKDKLESDKYEVLMDKNDIKNRSNFALISIAIVAGIVAIILLSRK